MGKAGSKPNQESFARQRLAAVRHVALDMDGTIYEGGSLFDSALPFLKTLEELGIGYSLLTNDSSRSARDYVAHLAPMGLDVSAGHVFTSGQATIDFLRRRHRQVRNLFVLGTESLCQEFGEAGFAATREAGGPEPDAVVAGFDTTLSYERLCTAGYWIATGKLFVATHPDLICPTDRQMLLVDCGAVCACLEAATGRSPDAVLGKPDPRMLDGILSRHNLRPHQVAVVGDRLYTDMALAHRCGAVGVLVLTGESTAADAEACPDQPDLVVTDLGALSHALRQATTTKKLR